MLNSYLGLKCSQKSHLSLDTGVLFTYPLTIKLYRNIQEKKDSKMESLVFAQCNAAVIPLTLLVHSRLKRRFYDFSQVQFSGLFLAAGSLIMLSNNTEINVVKWWWSSYPRRESTASWRVSALSQSDCLVLKTKITQMEAYSHKFFFYADANTDMMINKNNTVKSYKYIFAILVYFSISIL